MRVLLTGAAGFIGSHVASALVRRGHDVHTIVRPSSPANRLDHLRHHLTVWPTELLDQPRLRQVVDEVAPDAVMHLAWYTAPGRYLHDRPQNLMSLAASTALVGQLQEVGCRRLLLGGTCLEAGDGSAMQPTFYARAKRSLHDLATGLADDRLSVACGHIYSVYGPGEGEGRAIPSIARALLQGEIVDVTAGTQIRDYLHVADVAEGLCTALESEIVGGVDICSGRARPMRDVFEQIGEATGRGDLIRWGALPAALGEDFEVIGDPGPLMALGWKPSYSLCEGIRDTVAWWERQGIPALAATEDR